jgi:hypothetical protein
MGPITFEAYQAIVKKKAQYGRFVDTKQWDQMQAIALPSARFKFQHPDGTVISRDGKDLDFDSCSSFVDYFCQFFSNAQTLHMFGPPQMTLMSEDEASVIWAMEDRIYFQGNSRLAEIRGGGYYYETWVRKDSLWWLADLVLTRTYTKVRCIASATSYL